MRDFFIGTVGAAILALLLVFSPSIALADEDFVLMDRTTSYADVADAFDTHDPFDVNIHVDASYSRTHGRIELERGISDGRASSGMLDIGEHRHASARLNFGIDVGIYRDLMIYARLPLVLFDERQLTRGAEATPLFSTPFASPTRSGLDTLIVGAAWGILSSTRDANLPNLTLSVEGQFALGTPLRPCDASGAAGGRCRAPNEGGPPTATDDPGMTRGVNALKADLRASRRFGDVEPYGGVSFWIGWPGSASRLYVPAANLVGMVNTLPPVVTDFTLGAAMIPWEDRSRWQRFVVDIRGVASYISEGRDYSPLFDSLGTSADGRVTGSAFESPGNTGREIYFTGVTDVQSRARVGGRFGLEMQAARYVRFMLFAGAMWSTPYFVTFGDACNPGASTGIADPRCRSGVSNPTFRPVIDTPGQRFRVRDDFTFEVGGSIVGQF